jgi:hypothetical protein
LRARVRGCRCKPCPSGFFMSREGETQCEACPGGHTSPLGSTSPLQCVPPCPLGSFRNPLTATCDLCPLGTSADAVLGGCSPCLPGEGLPSSGLAVMRVATNAWWCCVVQCAVLCCAVLCCAVLCCAVCYEVWWCNVVWCNVVWCVCACCRHIHQHCGLFDVLVLSWWHDVESRRGGCGGVLPKLSRGHGPRPL